MRNSGSDNTSAIYSDTGGYGGYTGSTWIANNHSGGTAWGGWNTNGIHLSLWFDRPQEAAVTYFYGTYMKLSSSADAGIFQGIHNTASSFDGFSVFPDTGTITGTYWVYGFAKS